MEIGDKIPDVLGFDAEGNEIKAADYAGKKLVIYFYPKDNTPGCTAEACSLAAGYGDLQAAGYSIIGVSKDTAASHKKFAEKHSLPFPLIADTWQKKKMCGRECMGTVRTTFVVDEQGRVADIITKVNTKDAANQILNLNK